MKVGSLVKPKVPCTYLTPEDDHEAQSLDNWIEWSVNDVGVVLSNVTDDQILVMTPTGIGVIFENEVTIIARAEHGK